MKQMKRRDFLRAATLFGTASVIPYYSTVQSAEDNSGKRWYRGNLHTHSQWSDGVLMPECSIAWYKERGYHFLCPSDHNIFQNDELRFDAWCGACKRPNADFFKSQNSRWKKVEGGGWARLTAKSVAQAAEKFGLGSLVSYKEGNESWYRLKPFDELVKQFGEPGRFLLIPGFEQTGQSQDHRQVHMNFINVRSFFPYMSEATVQDTVDKTFTKGKEFFKTNPGPVMFTLNHPIWPYYDVEPQTLIDNTDIRFFEVNNNGLSYPKHPRGWTPEQYWDVVNAFRVSEGKSLLLATGTDDEHSYSSPDPRAWMVVRSDRLEFPALYDSMQKGDFYTSNGLDFEDIRFDRDSGTLSVKIKETPGTSYRIEFFGTKKNFNRKCEFVNVEKEGKKPARKISTWSKDIGMVFKRTDGIEASYTLQKDDLYVRARITTVVNGEQQWQDNLLPKPGAWSQPFSKLVY